MATDLFADPSGPGVNGLGLRPLAYWECGLESRREHESLSLVSVVCCHVEDSASGLSLVQRSPTGCGVSECDHKASIMGKPWHTRGCCAISKTDVFSVRYELQ
jgi:hypothetical protein